MRKIIKGSNLLIDILVFDENKVAVDLTALESFNVRLFVGNKTVKTLVLGADNELNVSPTQSNLLTIEITEEITISSPTGVLIAQFTAVAPDADFEIDEKNISIENIELIEIA